MKKILITGAAGFLGYHLSSFLKEQGTCLTLCDNFTRGRKDLAFESLCGQTDVSFLNIDLTDPKNYENLGGPFDEVYHLAAINGTRFFYEKPDLVLRTNLLSTIYLLDWFVNSGSKKFLFASTSETYAGTISLNGGPLPTPEKTPLCISDIQNPRFSYAASKIAGESLVLNTSRRHSLPMNIVRYHNVYGPRMGTEHVIPEFIQHALSKENPFKIYGGDQTRSFCFVSDAVKASVKLMQDKNISGEIFHIGNAREEIPISKLAEKICAVAQWKPRFEFHPAPEGSVARRLPDTTKIEKRLGFKPEINLTTGLAKTYEWYSHELRNS